MTYDCDKCNDRGWTISFEGFAPPVIRACPCSHLSDDEAVSLMIDAYDAMKLACRAQVAWAYAERTHGEAFSARMELSCYAEWLTERALEMHDDAYEGVPRLFVWPEVNLVREDQEAAQSRVDELIAQYYETADKVPQNEVKAHE